MLVNFVQLTKTVNQHQLKELYSNVTLRNPHATINLLTEELVTKISKIKKSNGNVKIGMTVEMQTRTQ